MAIITISGRAGMAKSIKNSPLYIAWGQGQHDVESNEKTPEDPYLQVSAVNFPY